MTPGLRTLYSLERSSEQDARPPLDSMASTSTTADLEKARDKQLHHNNAEEGAGANMQEQAAEPSATSPVDNVTHSLCNSGGLLQPVHPLGIELSIDTEQSLFPMPQVGWLDHIPTSAEIEKWLKLPVMISDVIKILVALDERKVVPEPAWVQRLRSIMNSDAQRELELTLQLSRMVWEQEHVKREGQGGG